MSYVNSEDIFSKIAFLLIVEFYPEPFFIESSYIT